MAHTHHVPRELDALLDGFAGPLDLGLPPAFRRADVAARSEDGWREGVEAERLRGLALIRQLREVTAGASAQSAAAALHFGVSSCLDAAERWRRYYRDSGTTHARFALLGRAEVASRLACALREIADAPRETIAAA